jgi:hypothetical protein
VIGMNMRAILLSAMLMVTPAFAFTPPHSGPALVQSATVCGTNPEKCPGTAPGQQCVYTFPRPIATGNTVVGFVHSSNKDDRPVPAQASDPTHALMYPQWVRDSAGNNYTLTTPTFWSPWPEYDTLFYRTNVTGNPTRITADFNQYPASGNTILGVCNMGFAEYSGVTAVSPVVNPVSVNGTSPSITITPTAPSLILTFASLDFQGVTTASQLTNAGFVVVMDSLAADDTAVWQSTSMQPAAPLTLIWTKKHYNDATCQVHSKITGTCPAVLGALAIR